MSGIPVIDTSRPDASAMGGYDGASRISRELAMDNPSLRSADGDLLPSKDLLDARARDQVRNDGYAMGAVAIHRDSIVGAQFVLNAKPNALVLGIKDEKWEEEFQEYVEAHFTTYAESPSAWIDASRHDTLTGLIRLALGVYVFTGESLLTAEWMRDGVRPYNTALQMIDVDRLSTPDDKQFDTNIRKGVKRNRFGAPMGYYIRTTHRYEMPFAQLNDNEWKYVPATKPWGRTQVIHRYERFRPDQTRGVAEMTAVLKEMKMTSKFQDVVLQNAVLNATYAASIESELPREAAMEAIGAGNSSSVEYATKYLQAVAAYSSGSKNMHIDGVKIPHLFPGSKLQLRPAGTAGGVGTQFEQSLLRHIAAALGLSYEQFSRDYSNTNYSSARASMNETWKYMQSRKKIVADHIAAQAYSLWLEEAWNKGELPLPRNAPSFYEGLNKEAYCACTWIGASRGQVDEMKETQAAILRVNGNLSTLEFEGAKLGLDWREVIKQKAREKRYAEARGVDLTPVPATKPGANDAKNSMDNGTEDKRPGDKGQDDE